MTYISLAPRFHRASAPLSAALASLPGYTAHTSALEALKGPLAEAKAAQQNAEQHAADLATGLAIGLLTLTAADAAGAIEDGAALAANMASMERAAASKVTLLEAAEQHLGIELDNIIRGAADRLLKHLDGTLKQAYAKSHKLGLQGIHDAEQAIAAGKADAWSTMIELRTTVFQCRTAQSDIIGRLGTLENVQRLSTFGTLENYAELDPTFLARRTSARWGNEHLTAPWPTQRDGSIDPADMHAWILNHPDAARPWIPTERELVNAVKTAEVEARAALAEQDA